MIMSLYLLCTERALPARGFIPEKKVVGHRRRGDEVGVQPSVVQDEGGNEEHDEGEAVEGACCNRC